MRCYCKWFLVVTFFCSLISFIGAQTPPKDKKAEKLREQAAKLIGKDNAKALNLIEQSLKIDPNYGHAYSNRGNIYSDMKDDDRAIVEYTNAIRVDPTYSIAYSNRAMCYFNKDDYNNVLLDCNKAIELDRNNTDAYIFRGLSYQYRGDFERALADFRKSVELKPSNNDIVGELITILQDTVKLTTLQKKIDAQYGKIDKTKYENVETNMMLMTRTARSIFKVGQRYSIMVLTGQDTKYGASYTNSIHGFIEPDKKVIPELSAAIGYNFVIYFKVNKMDDDNTVVMTLEYIEFPQL